MSYLPHSTLWEESEASNAVPLVTEWYDESESAGVDRLDPEPWSDAQRDDLTRREAKEFRSVAIRLFVFAFVVVGLIAGWVVS